jgi:hypothetical protein
VAVKHHLYLAFKSVTARDTPKETDQQGTDAERNTRTGSLVADVLSLVEDDTVKLEEGENSRTRIFARGLHRLGTINRLMECEMRARVTK